MIEKNYNKSKKNGPGYFITSTSGNSLAANGCGVKANFIAIKYRTIRVQLPMFSGCEKL